MKLMFYLSKPLLVILVLLNIYFQVSLKQIHDSEKHLYLIKTALGLKKSSHHFLYRPINHFDKKIGVPLSPSPIDRSRKKTLTIFTLFASILANNLKILSADFILLK